MIGRLHRPWRLQVSLLSTYLPTPLSISLETRYQFQISMIPRPYDCISVTLESHVEKMASFQPRPLCHPLLKRSHMATNRKQYHGPGQGCRGSGSPLGLGTVPITRSLHHESKAAHVWSNQTRHAKTVDLPQRSAQNKVVRAQGRQHDSGGPVVAGTATEPKREQWQIRKDALKGKFGEAGWKPRKKLSPDALDGIRMLHAHDPEKNSTAALAAHYQISPEAIRRILKSKWRPTATEHMDRSERWERRGERIWTDLANGGFQPPKKWRMKGIRKADHVSPDPSLLASSKPKSRSEGLKEIFEAHRRSLDSTSLANRII